MLDLFKLKTVWICSNCSQFRFFQIGVSLYLLKLKTVRICSNWSQFRFGQTEDSLDLFKFEAILGRQINCYTSERICLITHCQHCLLFSYSIPTPLSLGLSVADFMAKDISRWKNILLESLLDKPDHGCIWKFVNLRTFHRKRILGLL